MAETSGNSSDDILQERALGSTYNVVPRSFVLMNDEIVGHMSLKWLAGPSSPVKRNTYAGSN